MYLQINKNCSALVAWLLKTFNLFVLELCETILYLYVLLVMITMVCSVISIRTLDGGEVFPTPRNVLSFFKADVVYMFTKTCKRKTFILTNYFA